MALISIKTFWIFKQNFYPALLILSHLIGYEFKDDDLNAIKYGLAGTSDEKNIWLAYQLRGISNFDLHFAHDEGDTDIIFIRLSFDKKLSEQVDLTIFLVQEFDLLLR